MTAHTGHCPCRTGGNAINEPAQVGNGGWGAAWNAKHKVELHGSSGSLAFSGHLEDGVEVSHLKAFILGLDAALHHALAKGTHGGHGVVKYLIAKVAGSAVECCHLGKWSGIGRLKALIGTHAHGSAGRGNQYHIGTLLEDCLFTLLKTGTILGGGAIVPANVQVNDSCSGINGTLCLTNNLLYGIRHVWILLFGNLGTANGGGNYKFIHLIVISSWLLGFFLVNAFCENALLALAILGGYTGSARTAHYNGLIKLIGSRGTDVGTRNGYFASLKLHVT